MAPQKQTVIKLTSFRKKKDGVSDKDFHDFSMGEMGLKAAAIQARHGALKVTQVSLSCGALASVSEQLLLLPHPIPSPIHSSHDLPNSSVSNSTTPPLR